MIQIVHRVKLLIVLYYEKPLKNDDIINTIYEPNFSEILQVLRF